MKFKCVECGITIVQKPDDVWRETCPECGGELIDEDCLEKQGEDT